MTETGMMEEVGASERARTLLEGIAEKVSRSATARAVFGDPIERDGTTVIPVARVRFGFGGGGGGKSPSEGASGGAGVNVRPLGFIEINGDCARFRRIRTRSPMWTATLAALGLWLLVRRRGR